MKSKILVLSLVGFSLAAPLLVLAQQQVPQQQVPVPQPRTDITTVDQLFTLLNRIVGWVFTILMIVAVIFILRAAFTYLTAGGDPAKVGIAQSALIYAAVAIAVGIVAYSVPRLIEALLR